jgi:hypothetical protein
MAWMFVWVLVWGLEGKFSVIFGSNQAFGFLHNQSNLLPALILFFYNFISSSVPNLNRF